jgi:hypothetical protein
VEDVPAHSLRIVGHTHRLKRSRRLPSRELAALARLELPSGPFSCDLGDKSIEGKIDCEGHQGGRNGQRCQPEREIALRKIEHGYIPCQARP